MLFRQGIFCERSNGRIVPSADWNGRAEEREYVQRPTGRIANSLYGGFLRCQMAPPYEGRLVFILGPYIGVVASHILARQIGVHDMDDQFVVRYASFFQRLIAGDGQLVRINKLPLFPDTKIEMGAGRRAGRTHVAGGLPLPGASAVLHAFNKTRHMPIEQLQPVVMADSDLFAVASGPLDIGSDPVAHGHNGGSGRGTVIDTLMGPDVTEDQMLARHTVA